MKDNQGKKTFGAWAGTQYGIPEDFSRCIVDVWEGDVHYQCQQKRGYGEDGLYCQQHDPERVKIK